MGHGHQVGLGRQLVGRVAPVTIGEDAELAGLDEGLDAFLDIGEVAGGGLGPTADGLGQCRGGLGVGAQAADHVYPVQGMQVVEVHDMVMHILGTDHQVADEVGIGGDLVLEGVLYRADRGETMNQSADATDALREGPGVPGIAALQDGLDPAHHGPGGIGLRDVGTVHLGLDTQVSLDTGDRIYDDALTRCTLARGALIGGTFTHGVCSPARGLTSGPGFIDGWRATGISPWAPCRPGDRRSSRSDRPPVCPC
jgi:hypothetical protein